MISAWAVTCPICGGFAMTNDYRMDLGLEVARHVAQKHPEALGLPPQRSERDKLITRMERRRN